MTTVYIAEANGLRPVEVESNNEHITVEGIRYDAIGTANIKGQRVSVYRVSPRQVKTAKPGTRTCTRCNGTGHYHDLGVCFDCGGTGMVRRKR